MLRTATAGHAYAPGGGAVATAPEVAPVEFFVTIDAAAPSERALYADLHIHSDDTIGTNDTIYNLGYGRDVAGLDVFGYTANDFQMLLEQGLDAYQSEWFRGKETAARNALPTPTLGIVAKRTELLLEGEDRLCTLCSVTEAQIKNVWTIRLCNDLHKLALAGSPLGTEPQTLDMPMLALMHGVKP